MVARDFARIAGLLEIADDEFVCVRDGMKAYTDDIRQKIAGNCADDVPVDLITLQEFLERNCRMREFTAQLAAICGAELDPISPESYIEQLHWLGNQILGDLQNMLEEDQNLALAESMETPLAELPFLYEPVETWKIKAKSELTKQKEKSL